MPDIPQPQTHETAARVLHDIFYVELENNASEHHDPRRNKLFKVLNVRSYPRFSLQLYLKSKLNHLQGDIRVIKKSKLIDYG